ncbi:dnaJ homolog subfamily C member 2-like isoform X2 [Dysidea avara]|uniref:dnaJ homolog subfamily C member 2-like isoform X2 n=1 Tax=Dysidea avara TaxID=196820 RepID=UPI003321177B
MSWDNKSTALIVVPPTRNLADPQWYQKYVERQLEGTRNDSSDQITWSEPCNISELDPQQWKEQDHYAVLGLAHLRHNANSDHIRKAYRRTVMKYHPDKQDVSSEPLPPDSDQEAVFTCIKIAYDILSTPKKRRAYDSVDPNFDDTLPSVTDYNKEHFFEVFGPVFKSNARWSNKRPVPLLGNSQLSYEELDKFYTFWYNFDSWREFSYEDQEEIDKAENREERRWLERQNKSERQRKRREEVQRLRDLVDNAYKCDPRIEKYLAQEQEEKAAKKRAKEEAVRKKEQERREQEEEMRLQREMKEEEQKQQAAAAKKEKEIQKKLLKKERKSLRCHCQEHGLVAEGDNSSRSDVDQLCEHLSLTRIQELNQRLSQSHTSEDIKMIVEQEVAVMKEEKSATVTSEVKAEAPPKPKEQTKSTPWNQEQLQLLVKGVNLYPPGTADRWNTIADYINSHVQSDHKTAAMVVTMVKKLQKLGPLPAKDLVEKLMAEDGHSAVVKNDKVTVQTTRPSASATPLPWSAEEQKQLEKALRTFPQSEEHRWDKIASMIPSRSRQECVQRYKDLVSRVQAKRQSKKN